MDLAVGSFAKCRHLFEAEHPAELALTPGDLVQVLEPDRDGWTYCSLVADPERKGCAPTKFLEPGGASSSSRSIPADGAGASRSGSNPPAQLKAENASSFSAAATASPVYGANNNSNNNNNTSAVSASGGGGPYRNSNPQSYSALAQASVTAANNASQLVRSGSAGAGGGGASANVPDSAALMEGFHKNELYFQQLLVQRQESTSALDSALREAATEIDLAKEKHASMTRRLKELDHMVTKERKRWKDRVEEERLLLAQRAGASGSSAGQQQQQQQQQPPSRYGSADYGAGAPGQIDMLRRK